jgi:hypothetical protein
MRAASAPKERSAMAEMTPEQETHTFQSQPGRQDGWKRRIEKSKFLGQGEDVICSYVGTRLYRRILLDDTPGGVANLSPLGTSLAATVWSGALIVAIASSLRAAINTAEGHSKAAHQMGTRVPSRFLFTITNERFIFFSMGPMSARLDAAIEYAPSDIINIQVIRTILMHKMAFTFADESSLQLCLYRGKGSLANLMASFESLRKQRAKSPVELTIARENLIYLSNVVANYRELVASDPAAYRPKLAASLESYAKALRAFGYVGAAEKIYAEARGNSP